jgi:hypothetical protein
MSALPPKADIPPHGGNVCFVPKADICRAANSIIRQPEDAAACGIDWDGLGCDYGVFFTLSRSEARSR